MVDGGVGFDGAGLGDGDGADAADSAQVVALQVHDHVELGLVFDGMEQFDVGAGHSRASAFDGTGQDATGAGAGGSDVEEKLRRIAEQGVPRIAKTSAVPGRGMSEQPAVDFQGIVTQANGKTLGEVDLKDVAGGNVVDGALDGVLVSRAGEVGSEGQVAAGEMVGRRHGGRGGAFVAGENEKRKLQIVRGAGREGFKKSAQVVSEIADPAGARVGGVLDVVGHPGEGIERVGPLTDELALGRKRGQQGLGIA